MQNLVFSCNRPMQIHGLITSIKEYTNLVPTILYRCDEEFREGYDIVKSEHRDCTFIQEEDFYRDTMNILSSFGEVVGFSTDDVLFFDYAKEFPSFGKNECFSFRYGLNTTLQDFSTGLVQPSLNIYTENGPFISWNPHLYQYPNNYSYSFALDQHFYKKELLLDIIDFEFRNSNQLEGILQKKRDRINVIHSYRHSKCVSIPVNCISGLTPIGGAKSLQELNKLFLDGKRIDLKETFLNVNIIGSHQVVEFQYEQSRF